MGNVLIKNCKTFTQSADNPEKLSFIRFVIDFQSINWSDLNFIRHDIRQDAHFVNLNLSVRNMNESLIGNVSKLGVS
jgi:hypothetical protein